ncbi:hypothetical protein SEPCBS57363_006747, partial [Sporothrix epigloea]
RTGSWKAAGRDGPPKGFLKACGQSLLEALQVITEASLRLGYFSRVLSTRADMQRKYDNAVLAMPTRPSNYDD